MGLLRQYRNYRNHAKGLVNYDGDCKECINFADRCFENCDGCVGFCEGEERKRVDRNIAAKKKALAEDADTALVETMFGLFLGENIADVRKRFKLTAGVKTSDPDDLSKCWRVTPAPAGTKFVSLVVFEDRVMDILFSYTDCSSANFTAMQERLRRTYDIEFEQNEGSKWVIQISEQGVSATIALQPKKGDALYLRYCHASLYEKAWEENSRRKTARISGDL